jgi:hypothetical protein
MENLGIDKVQDAVDAVADLVLNVIEAVKDEDGLTLAEGLAIGLESVPEFASVWENRVELLAQLKDVDLDELIVLINGVIDKLELDNKELEAVIKKGLFLVVAGADFGIAIKEYKS